MAHPLLARVARDSCEQRRGMVPSYVRCTSSRSFEVQFEFQSLLLSSFLLVSLLSERTV